MQAAQAYAKSSHAALTPRQAEAAVLIKAARRLQAVRTGGLEDAPALNEALMFNQRVWTLIASSVADPSTPLPEALRDSVTRLAVFVFRTIIDAMIEPTARKLDTLVSLNHQIAAGLQGDPEPAAG